MSRQKLICLKKTLIGEFYSHLANQVEESLTYQDLEALRRLQSCSMRFFQDIALQFRNSSRGFAIVTAGILDQRFSWLFHPSLSPPPFDGRASQSRQPSLFLSRYRDP